MPSTLLDLKFEASVLDTAGPISPPKERDRVQAEHHSGPILIDVLLARALAGPKVLLRRIAEWRRRAAGRRELMTLTDRDLHDIGTTRTAAQAEANKPFWEM
jgi:uncharacterized protein YjiS (DUF1127 family)